MKSANQIHRNKKKENIKAHSEIIQEQKKEIENLKVTSMQMDLEKLTEAMTHNMACMYNMKKDPSKKLSGAKPLGSKPYLGKSKQPQITKGLIGTNEPNLTC